GDADFTRATFDGRTTFRFAKFRGDIIFERSTFNGEADFGSAAFDQAASFHGTRFKDNVSFRYARFSQLVDFSQAHFASYLRFVGKRSPRTSLEAGLLENPVFQSQSALRLRFVRIEKAERVSFHSVYLRPGWFRNVDPRKFELTDIDWDDVSHPT